jgi:hypothetical protein
MEKRAIPKGLVVFRQGNAVVIRRRWEKGAGASVLLFTAASAWPILLNHQGRSHGDGIWPMALEYLTHLAPAIGTAYFGLCSLVNRTDVILSGDRFRAESTPLPWWGDRKVSAQEIYAVTVKQRKAGEDGAKFCLMYIDRDGKEHELLRAGKGREQVDFIGEAAANIMGMEFRAPQSQGKEGLRPWMQRINKWAVSAGRAAAKRGGTSAARNSS